MSTSEVKGEMALFPDLPGEAAETSKLEGMLPSQEIRELIAKGHIQAPSSGVTEKQIQPASLDLRLGDIAYRVQRLPIGMVLMYVAGLISALLGIGSGVLKVPAMDTALRLPIKVSSATSNFMISVTAAASAGAYFVRGDIVAPVAGPVALGSVVGAILGARLLMSISNERVRLLFVVVLAALAVQMFVAAFGKDLFRGIA